MQFTTAALLATAVTASEDLRLAVEKGQPLEAPKLLVKLTTENYAKAAGCTLQYAAGVVWHAWMAA